MLGEGHGDSDRTSDLTGSRSLIWQKGTWHVLPTSQAGDRREGWLLDRPYRSDTTNKASLSSR